MESKIITNINKEFDARTQKELEGHENKKKQIAEFGIIVKTYC